MAIFYEFIGVVYMLGPERLEVTKSNIEPGLGLTIVVYHSRLPDTVQVCFFLVA
jgi:hypothetical protein